MTSLLQNFIKNLTEYDKKLALYEKKTLARCFRSLKKVTALKNCDPVLERDEQLSQMIEEFQKVSTPDDCLFSTTYFLGRLKV